MFRAHGTIHERVVVVLVAVPMGGGYCLVRQERPRRRGIIARSDTRWI
jgi:hypothetical protein